MVTKTQAQKSKNTSKEVLMNPLEPKIRKILLDSVREPRECVKTDVIFYKHKAGRLNHWHKRQNSPNLDIESYYFTYDETKLEVHSDQKVEITVYF